jgi:PPOX class probable F420-dependent enzyme
MTREGERLPDWAEELLESARVARLATAGRSGLPLVVPVCFARIAGAVFIPVDEKPKRPGELARVRNLRRDPRATLLIDHYDEDWTQLAWVRLECGASVQETGAENPAALAALRKRYPQYRAMNLEALPLLRFNVERAVCWRWQS